FMPRRAGILGQVAAGFAVGQEREGDGGGKHAHGVAGGGVVHPHVVNHDGEAGVALGNRDRLGVEHPARGGRRRGDGGGCGGLGGLGQGGGGGVFVFRDGRVDGVGNGQEGIEAFQRCVGLR